MIAERLKPVNDAPGPAKMAALCDWAQKTTNRMLKAAILHEGHWRRGQRSAMPAGSIKAIVAAILVTFGLGNAPAPPPDRLGLPALMLWSWDRADDLRFIDPADTGVAYLAGAIGLTADSIAVVPRRNPLLLPQSTATIAVIHIAFDRTQPPALDDATRDRLVAAIVGLRPAKSRSATDRFRGRAIATGLPRRNDPRATSEAARHAALDDRPIVLVPQRNLARHTAGR